MPIGPLHERRTLRALLVATGLTIGASACAPPPPAAPAPAPQPTPSDTTPTTPAMPTAPAPVPTPAREQVRDSVTVRIDRAPVRVVAARPPAVALPRSEPRDRPVRAQLIPRSVRNDSLPVRTLRGSVRVCAGGDVTLGTNLSAVWTATARARMAALGLSGEPANLLAPLRPLVAEADVVLLNIESAIGEGPASTKCGPKSKNCFAFRSPSSAAPALRALTDALVVGNVANNHARDVGDIGRDSTIAALGRVGVLVTGADTIATAVPTPYGDSIGVIGFYTSTETPDARDTAAVFRHIARAARRFPVVIATMHLGAEGYDAQRTIDRTELFLDKIDRGNPVAFADAAVRGGAALVIGHGPHVLRAMEWREGGALVAYSLGNLLTYGPFGLKEPLNRGAVLCATVDTTGRVSDGAIASTMQRAPGVLVRDSTDRAAALMDSLAWLDFPVTGARVEPSGTLRGRLRR